jgi:hypothetical protein
MAIGDYLSEMFLGNSGGGQSEATTKGTEQLWKLYQQAYNVKPVWDGKKWTIPPGAIQRFQMLLPILQAQIAAGRSGQQAGNDKGMLAGLLGSAGKGLAGAVGSKMGGWEGILNKVGGGVSSLFDKGMDSWNYSPAEPFSQTAGAAGDWDAAFSPPQMDTLPQEGWDTQFDAGNTGEDWWSNMPTDSLDFVDAFSPEDYAAAGDWW